MTKAKALKIMLQISEECAKHVPTNGGSGCRDCAFGYGNRCLASGGNDIPSTWLINEKIYEWMRGAKE